VSVLENHRLRDYLDHCVALYTKEFNRSTQDLPPPFDLGLSTVGSPVFEKQPGQDAEGTKILLAPIDDEAWGREWPLRSQAGHEVFHWLFTPPAVYPGIYHWAHEMLANEMSLLCVRKSGIEDAEDYARSMEIGFRAKVQETTRVKMLTTELHRDDGATYAWVFGRAFSVGRQLRDAVGWEHLKGLATSLEDERRPDLRGWLAALPRPLELRAINILGQPHPNWV